MRIVTLSLDSWTCKNKLGFSSVFSSLVSGTTRNQELQRGTKLELNKINKTKESQDIYLLIYLFNIDKINFQPEALFAE